MGVPAVQSPAQIDIHNESSKIRGVGFEFAQRLSVLRHVGDIKLGRHKTFFHIVPEERLVLHQQKGPLVSQRRASGLT